MKTKLFTLLFAIVASTMMANALQTYTVSEAIAAFDAGTLKTGDSCQIIGAISKWCPKTTAFSTYKSISYYITDGAKEFEFYCSYSLGKAQYSKYDYTSDSLALCQDVNGQSLFLGDTVIGAGKIKKYGNIYEFDMNCYLKEIRPAKPSPFIVAEGTCGDNATWAITYPGWVLNITGEGAIQRSNNYWDLYELYIDSVAIGEGITEIGDSAFYYCSSLTSVMIPNSVTSIGKGAFYGCTGLTSIEIPNSVTSIGDYAFLGCSSLTSIEIPNSVTSIGDNAFLGCSGLTSITIPNSVTSIGNGAFTYCRGLTSVTIPNSVTSIGGGAFDMCTGLTSVHISDLAAWCNISFGDGCANPLSYANNLYLNGDLVTNLIIPNSVTSIGDYVFYGCSGLTSVTIGNSVTSIGNGPFTYCSGLTSIEIPNNVTNIGKYAFRGCTGLTSIEIPNSVISIGDSVFYGCSKLASITIPNSVTSIGNGAFTLCIGLTSIEIPNSVASIGNNAFYGCTGLTSVAIGNSVTSIGSGAFCGCTGLTSVEIPHSVTSIGDGAFSGCTGLTSATIGNSVRSIGNKAFYNCSGMTSVIIGNSVTSIGNSAFYGCTGLTSATIGNSVTSIGNSAFSGCTGLTSIEIPHSVTSIGDGAFSGCTGLTSATIGNSVRSIGNKAFYNCSGMTSVIIGNSVTSIGAEAFYNCYRMISLSLGNSVTSIGNSAFYGCTGLTSVTIPNSVISIGNSAFYYCKGIISVTIGNSVTDIGEEAFRFCTGLTSVIIGNSVTSIGNMAFNECISLTSVHISDLAAWCKISFGDDHRSNPLSHANNLYLNGDLITNLSIPDTVTSIGNWAFSGCSSLTSVTIGNSVANIGGGAFYCCNGLSEVYILPETPPTLSGSNCFPTSATIYVPCGQLETYQTAEGWSAYASNMRYETSLLTVSMTPMEGGYIEGITDSISVCLNSDFVLTAVPNDGYYFSQWSDGNTDNPRIIAVSRDTTFSAEFGIAKKGTCGVNRALTWEYEEKSKTLTISGKGELTENYIYGVEAPTQMRNLIIGNEVTSIGDSAFYGMKTINHLTIGSNVSSIGDYAFAECKNFDDITCYASDVPTINATTFANIGNKQYIYLYVPEGRQRAYQRDTYWGEFDVQVKEAETITQPVTEVSITPADNSATVIWPTSDEATTYTLEITKDGVVFCTLIFNANGQLQGIAFAPGKNNQHQAPAAVKTSNGGLRFTVTGLNSATHYALTLQAKDDQDAVLASYSSEFTTTGTATGINQITNDKWEMTNKILHNGQIFILRGDKTYTLQGQEIIVP